MKHGILTDDGILTSGGWKSSAIQIAKIETIADILDIARACNLAQVYVLNDSKVFRKFVTSWKGFLNVDRCTVRPMGVPKNCYTAWANNHRAQIIFCGDFTNDHRPRCKCEECEAKTALLMQWPIWSIADPKRLFDAVGWIARKLDVYPVNPFVTAKSLLERTSGERIESLNEPDAIYRNNKAEDLIFFDRGKAKGKKYIHSFDKTSAYLVSVSSVPFGLGDSILQKAGDFNKNFHGLWKCEFNFDAVRPDHMKFIELIRQDNEYLWTPDIDVILSLGARARVIDANIWKYNRRVFEKFYKLLSSVRNEAKGLGLTPEEQSIKATYTRFFGFLYSANNKSCYRPDWHSAVISATRANMIRNIVKIREQNPEIEVLCCHRDALIFATNEADHKKLPYPLNPIDGKDSPYKYQYSFERSEVDAIIKDSEAGTLDKNLKQFSEISKIERTKKRLSALPKIGQIRTV